MPPKKRARVSQVTSPAVTDPTKTPTPAAQPDSPSNPDEVILNDPWTDEETIGLFKAIIKWKPTGKRIRVPSPFIPPHTTTPQKTQPRPTLSSSQESTNTSASSKSTPTSSKTTTSPPMPHIPPSRACGANYTHSTTSTLSTRAKMAASSPLHRPMHPPRTTTTSTASPTTKSLQRPLRSQKRMSLLPTRRGREGFRARRRGGMGVRVRRCCRRLIW
jgi:hypothetical protein